MTQSFFASLEAAGQLIEDEMDAVFRGAVQDTAELMTRRAVGTTDGGTVTEGFVPVVTGELINSQETRLNGGAAGSGPVAYEALMGMGADDVAEHVFTAEHARPKEYGHGTAPGWFFVRAAVQQWDAIVGANVRHIKE